ncbi:hypothetical protein B0H16DRAFT_1474984 [Mycena metata]|uniref:Uncharacterized protein n=1 Tax=Mycena metata TaxID=1033252 RepID=A0AAD7MJM7_9AGAR|nr:hypothetical protein B0H16DRAFT_1474984 [Mycena metata]
MSCASSLFLLEAVPIWLPSDFHILVHIYLAYSNLAYTPGNTTTLLTPLHQLVHLMCCMARKKVPFNNVANTLLTLSGCLVRFHRCWPLPEQGRVAVLMNPVVESTSPGSRVDKEVEGASDLDKEVVPVHKKEEGRKEVEIVITSKSPGNNKALEGGTYAHNGMGKGGGKGGKREGRKSEQNTKDYVPSPLNPRKPRVFGTNSRIFRPKTMGFFTLKSPELLQECEDLSRVAGGQTGVK